MDWLYNTRSSSLPRHRAALPQPLQPRRGPQISLQAGSSPPSHVSPPSTPTTPTQRGYLPSNHSHRSGSSTPRFHPLGPPTFLGIPSLLREDIYTHLLLPRGPTSHNTTTPSHPLIPYSSHAFPTAILCVCRLLHLECRAFLTVNNTFNVVLSGTGGIAPGGLFSAPTSTTPRLPRAGWITSLRVHLHVDLSGLFATPGPPPPSDTTVVSPRAGNGEAIIKALENLMVLMWQLGMPCLSTVELVLVEVIPEVLRIHPTCAIFEPDVRRRYRALAKPLFKGLGNEVSVVVVGLEGVYVPDLVEETGEDVAGEEKEGECEEAGDGTPGEEHAGLGRRQGSEQPRVLRQGMDGWDRAEDYEYLCMESLKELGKGERGPKFVDERGIEGGSAAGYGPREVFGAMVRAREPLAGGQKGAVEEEDEEEDDEDERRSGLAGPSEGKRRGLGRFVSESRLALRLTSGEKDKDRAKEQERAEREAEKMLEKRERELEKEAKERLKEKEKLEKEREKQRAKAKREQEKMGKMAEKRKSEGNKDVDSQEQKEGLRDKIRWFGQKKDGDEKEPKNSTW